jgi:hypothetical protein
MDHKNRFGTETIRQLQQSLDEMAPYQATELSKQQAVRALLPQISALRAKGYSWTAVAAMLSKHGVPVSVAALRTYLRRAREEAASEASRPVTRRLRDRRAVTDQAEPPPIARSPSPGPAASTASKPQPPGAPPASSATRPATSAAPRHEQEPRRPATVVRPDTDDL